MFAREIARVIFRRRVLILATFAVITLGVSYAVATQPMRFEAVGKLLVKRSRGDLLLTPTDTRNVNFMLTLPQTQDLAAQVEFLQNRSLLEAVAAKLGIGTRSASASVGAAPRVMEATLTRAFEGLGGWGRFWPWGRSAGENGGSGIAGDRVADLQRNLAVRAIPNSNVIEVRFRDSDPEQAARVVNTLMALYLDRYLEIQRTPGATGFFAAHRDRVAAELRQAEEALRQFQEKAGIVDAGAQVEAYARRLAEARQNMIDARFDYREIEAKLAASRAFLDQQPERVLKAVTSRVNPLLRVMQERLLALEMEREKLLHRYTEHDRRVRDIEGEIAALKMRMRVEPEWVTDTQTSELNQLRRDLEEKVAASEVSLARLRIKEENWTVTAGEMRQLLTDLALRSLEKQRLEREVRAREEAYLLYRRKVEEARIAEAMDESKIMNVSIAERASAPAVPVGPKKNLAFAVAAAVGLVSGVAGAFVREFFDRSIKFEEQLQSAVDVPLLATIPESKRNGGTRRDGGNA